MTFINESTLIIGEVSTELTGLVTDLPTYFLWGIIFMGLFLFFTLITSLVDRLSGSVGK